MPHPKTYSNEEIQCLLRKFAAAKGLLPSGPKCNEWLASGQRPSVTTIKQRFGSWKGALEASGLCLARKKGTYTKEEVIQRLQAAAAALGRSPTTREAKRYVSHDAVAGHFGSWSNGFRAAGLSARGPGGTPIEDSALLGEIVRLYRALGRAPTHDEMKQQGRYSITSYVTHFGAWTTAVEAAGLDPVRHRSSIEATRSGTPRRSNRQMVTGGRHRPRVRRVPVGDGFKGLH